LINMRGSQGRSPLREAFDAVARSWWAGGVSLSAAEAEAERVLGDPDGAQERIRDEGDGMRSHERKL
jgi:hypothetical protein